MVLFTDIEEFNAYLFEDSFSFKYIFFNFCFRCMLSICNFIFEKI